MNVKTLCLAILYDRDVTGYDIRKMFTDGDYSYFVDASFGSIYPALAKLEAEKLVSSQVEAQTGKPAKKIYSITQTGRDEFKRELHQSMASDVFRSEFLFFARYASLVPASLVQARIEEQLCSVTDKIDHLKNLECDSRTSEDIWITNYGIQCLSFQRDYLRTHAKDLIASAQQSVEAAE